MIPNGLTIVSATDATGATNTKHGLRANGDSTVRYDDFSITDNAGGGGGGAGPLIGGGRLLNSILLGSRLVR